VKEAYLSALLEEEEIMPGPVNCVVIFLPSGWLPEKEELTVLDRMLTALGFRQGERRFCFYKQGEGATGFSGQAELILEFSQSEIEQPVKKSAEEGEQVWFLLPPIRQLMKNSELKRKVWDLLKSER